MSFKKARHFGKRIDPLYPNPSAGRMAYYALRRWVPLALLAVFVICALINLFVGGQPWSLYVLLAEAVGFSGYRSRDLLKKNPPHWALNLLSGLCLLLLVIEWGQGGLWTPLETAPGIMLGALSAGFLLTFAVRRRPPPQPLIKLILLSLLVWLVAFLSPWPLSWVHTALLCEALGLAIALLIGRRISLLAELKKRFRA